MHDKPDSEGARTILVKPVPDEGRMARLAAELAAVGDPRHGQPDPPFVEQLRLRMRDADAGIAAVRSASPPVPIHRVRPDIGDLRASPVMRETRVSPLTVEVA